MTKPSIPWLEDARRDAQYAVRMLRRSPGFTAIAVLTVALGVGANTAIFSVIDAVLLRPLPFEQPERLVEVHENVPAAESPTGRPRRLSGLDVRQFLALKEHSKTLSHVVSRAVALVSVAGGVDTAQRELTSVSMATFPMLGVRPVLGRWFTPQEEQPGFDRVIILSHGAWQRYFGGDPLALGKTLTFNGNTFSAGVALGDDYTVVGVMPPAFHFPDDSTEFWIPFPLAPPPDGRLRRVPMMARLADGATIESAAAEIASIVTAGPSRFEVVHVEDEVGASVKPLLLVLAGAVGFVLLIACANVANLLLARTAARQREIAVRIAIGAGRGRLVRQLLTESVLLSVAGGVAGTLFAAGGVYLFRNLATDLGRIDLGALGLAFPRLDAVRISAPVLAFAIAVSVVTGFLFGLLPALRYQPEALKGRRFNPQAPLVVAEVAMATVLFIGAGLLIHSFMKLTRVELGYDPAHVLTFQVSLPGARRPMAEVKRFAEDLVAALRSIPGVQSAAYGNQLPMVALENGLAFRTPDQPPPPAQGPPPNGADVRLVSRDYLKAMGIRVIAGRAFDESDDIGNRRVLLINRVLARRDFPDGNPVGAVVYIGRDTNPWEVIGVVADVRQQGLDREPRPQFFANIRSWTAPQVPVFPVGAYYAIRTTSDPSRAIDPVRDVVRRLNARASLENVATMEQIVSNRMTRPRMYAVLLGTFAGIAVVLAAAGIYGVMAYSVVQRTREIGIRVALGAQPRAVLALVMRQSAAMTMAGIAIGVAAAFWTTRYLQAMLFGVTPLEPSTFAAVILLFVAVAIVASYVPARRATAVDPSVALRAE